MQTICLNCNVEFTFNKSSSKGKFCSSKCNGEYTQNQNIKFWLSEKFIPSSYIDRSTLRKYLSSTRGYKCEICALSEWQGKKITLEVDHINGLSNDNSPKNVRLLCPNCHSQTPFRGQANKGRGRKSLGVKY